MNKKDKTRQFYINPSGMPYTANVEHSLIGGSRIPILKIIKEKFKTGTHTNPFSSKTEFTIEHGLNRRVDYFGRWRNDIQEKNNSGWNMLEEQPTTPSTGVYATSIDKNTIDMILFPDDYVGGLNKNIYIELYFLDFGF